MKNFQRERQQGQSSTDSTQTREELQGERMACARYVLQLLFGAAFTTLRLSRLKQIL